MPAEKLYVSPKEVIIKDLATNMEVSIETVEKVISWAYMKANLAIKEKREVEMSGLGKFYISQAKVRRRKEAIMKYLEDTMIAEKRRAELEAELEFVKTKELEQT